MTSNMPSKDRRRLSWPSEKERPDSPPTGNSKRDTPKLQRPPNAPPDHCVSIYFDNQGKAISSGDNDLRCQYFQTLGRCKYLHPNFPDATGTYDPNIRVSHDQYAAAQKRCLEKYGPIPSSSAPSKSQGKGKGKGTNRGKGKGKGGRRW